MRRKKEYETVVMAMVKRGGMWKATKAVGYVVAWSLCAREIGHPPTWAEYTGYWGQSESTTAREVRAFIACVPEGVKVGDVWESVRQWADSDDREQLTAQVMSAPWKVPVC